jgi:hypothetical protein
MNIIRKHELKTIQGFIHIVKGNRVYYDPSIQRRKVWNKYNKDGYRESLIEGTDTSNIVLCDIKTSMGYSFSTNNTKDYDYFSNLWNQGYRYISIDGGNRTEYLLGEFNKIDWSLPLSDEMFDFFNTEISLKYLLNATKNQLHKTFINLNSGEAANPQEKRNAMTGVVSEFVRKIGIEYSDVFLMISGLNFSRMKDLELLSQFLLYHQSPLLPIKNKSLNLMYKNTEILNEKQFLDIMKLWGKCVSLIHSTESKITKTTSFNLFMFLLEMNREFNSVLNKETINEFVDKYLELENDRIQRTFHNPLETNWVYLGRNMGNNLVYKFDTIYNDFSPYIKDYFYQLDSVRVFSMKDKLRKCIETEGVITRLDGSVEVVTPLQVMNGKKVHGGHKDIPFSKAGQTEYDNLELQISSDNIKQSNNH